MNLQMYMMPVITEVLGPYKRCAFWVQGCDKRCKGCIAEDAWDSNGGQSVAVKDLADHIIYLNDIEGITISGGEPFLQQDALCELIECIKSQRNIGVIVYTGMLYSEIENTHLAELCDLIIDGEYIEELNDDKSLRGSSNQNIICITDRYRDVIDNYYGIQGRKIELLIGTENTQMIGIPSRKVLDKIGG